MENRKYISLSVKLPKQTLMPGKICTLPEVVQIYC